MTRHNLHRDAGFVEATRADDGTIVLRVRSGDRSVVAILDAETAAALGNDLVDAAFEERTG